MKKLLRQFAAFRRAEEGIAYLEFALCVPFILALMMASVEITRYIMIVQKVEKVAVTISDVSSQGETISHSDLDNIILAAGQVMQPFTFGARGYVIISSVEQTGTPSASNPPKVKWQYTGGGTWVQPSVIGTPGGNATLPNGFSLFDKDNVIIAEVFYNFTPMVVPPTVIDPRPIYKVGIYKPRLGALDTLSSLPYWMAGKGAFL